MKLYPTLNVNLVMQDFGTSWFILMEGLQKDVDLMFNAAFNFGATSEKQYAWDDITEIGGTFYSTEARMKKFFEGYLENFYYNAGCSQEDATAFAKLDAPDLVEHLYQDHRQSRKQYKSSSNEIFDEAWKSGNPKAEKPDVDFKDSVIEYGYRKGLELDASRSAMLVSS